MRLDPPRKLPTLVDSAITVCTSPRRLLGSPFLLCGKQAIVLAMAGGRTQVRPLPHSPPRQAHVNHQTAADIKALSQQVEAGDVDTTLSL